ncbi:NADH-ubiquinone oxidoreductase B8 subunit [Culex quinquefasciatus]|uniref:NADH dehydrogenase [ubiquinone] 1 alpha subcomplex subunit 2 n=3 Tax=Culex pipiens complex TaxID=518105 RepID=B0WUY1_CULQU|nr:NADH dehydrogenase [ubiquinone] 1 alpha subcomplex subunit 2 [Culex quinquefasciatus]XP_039431397.1 NADH dehydrogenase [ubiquinone] 1 alpha subcomplex subunit 2 [Culex pipiens pallens]EDS35299.1 NADH-ubiquinone oxidoreductase B8 subunit [Culex quinquefasciatus]|eukprot:XP_001859930.1 NADH-ubiquinone oxidoreductase B8 subunit [Culex quinquefasciatus]
MRLSLLRAARLSPALKELRVHLCQTGEESKGVREFVSSQYAALKRDNPKLPILIRECSGVQPRLWARYEMGKEKSVSLTNAAAADVAKHIAQLGQ